MTIKIGSTKVTVGFSFFAVITLMLLISNGDVVAVCLMSSLLHECGHLAFMLAFGARPLEVVFGAYGIRIERTQLPALSYKKEAVVSIGGVAVNLALALLFFLIFSVRSSKTAFAGIFSNLFIAALNLMPIGILDCGNFLRYILLERFDAQKTGRLLSKISNAAVCVLCILCVFYTVFVGVNISFIIVCVYVIAVNTRQQPV